LRKSKVNKVYKKELAHAIKISKKVATNCLAYNKYLKLNKIDITRSDFFNLPILDKTNYILKYPLEERIFKGKSLADYYMICTSSGSTTEPTIWPRDYNYDLELEPPHTKFLNEHFSFTKKKTLVVIAFGLGTTQAGMMHVKASWEGSVHGQISVITPNADAEHTVFLLNKLNCYYEQILVIGYPPIIDDFIDLAIQKKMPIRKWNLKIIFTGESVSPFWRTQIAQKICSTEKDIVSFYGNTEAGMVGFESKAINKLITYCIKNEQLRFDLFRTFNLPTIVEVNFLKKFIEIVNEEIIVTVDQAVPLVRYNLHDRGIIINSADIQAALDKHKVHYTYPKNSRILVIYGRNLSRKISIEDLQNVFDILDLDHYFYKEFQYKETETTRIIALEVTFYTKNNFKPSAEILKIIKNKLEKNISKLIFTQLPIEATIKIKNEKERHGYKFGKLRYLDTSH